MAGSVVSDDIEISLADYKWTICSTYHMILKASSGEVTFGRDIMVGIPMANWHKISDRRQQQTDLKNCYENHS